MPPLSLPVIENEIRQILELTTQHEELTRTAQGNEEAFGDLAFGSETNTENFMTIFPQLKNIFNSFATLYATGRLHPPLLASLMLHFKYHLDAETKNAQNYKKILAMEERHDTEHHRHADILSDLELRHIILLVAKDEIRLREQGAQNTPLQDIDFDD